MTEQTKQHLIWAIAIAFIIVSVATGMTIESIYAPKQVPNEKIALIEKCIGSNSQSTKDCTQMVLDKYKGE